MKDLTWVLKQPLLTEKSSAATEKYNRYGFLVDLKATKNQIKEAVEKHYDVKVVSVRTSVTPGKLRRVGKAVKKSSKRKSAYVQVNEGQKIEFFKGI